jgi:thiosulfate/3-mercaptopyruvate sulfurtransferase
VAGHIPGAINLPAGETVDANGLLRLPEQVTELDGPVGAYCGSGVTAAQLVLALTVAGHEPALYVGSWSHWITDPSRPIERTVP